MLTDDRLRNDKDRAKPGAIFARVLIRYASNIQLRVAARHGRRFFFLICFRVNASGGAFVSIAIILRRTRRASLHLALSNPSLWPFSY